MSQQNLVFTNPNEITIPNGGAATTYPSSINVSGLNGTITSVKVTLSNITHTYPDDIDILLIGPTGANILLMSDAGWSWDLNNVTLTFDPNASDFLPDQGQISSGSYRATDYETGDRFNNSPAPSGNYGIDFSVFNNTIPNGTWNLYIVDDTGVDSGNIAGGWSIAIDTTEVTTKSVVTLSTSPKKVAENSGANILYTFTRTGNITSELTVNYAVSGSAIFNTDYSQTGATSHTATTGTVSFAAGADTVTLTIFPLEDNIQENDETIILTLATGTDYIIGTTTAFTGTITNGNDQFEATGSNLVSNKIYDGGDGTDRLVVDYSSASFGYLGYHGLGITNIYADSFEAYRPVSAGWSREILLNYSNIETFEITGTAYADYLRGYSGDDTLIGGEGNDDIAGGDGNDLIRGGDGNDTLKGEGGNDEIEGGDGNDTIDSGTGRHVIRGGKGDDTVVTAKAGDSIDGGEGTDTLQSLDLSSLGVNLVLDLRATEQVSGDNNTRINNFENISSVTLGSGYDTIIATSNLLVSNGSINAGGGTDTLIADYSSASFTYLGNGGYGVTNTYTNSFEGLWHRLVWGSQPLLNYNNVEVFQVTGTEYADYLRGYSGDDTLIGAGGNDNIAGGDGNDLVRGGEGNDNIAGGDGNDIIRGGDGNDTLKGEGGNDEIEGGDGNDTIDGGTGRHVIRAGTGDDTVVSAKAGDSIDGEGGNDTLQSLDLSSLGVNLVLDLRATEQVSGDNNTRINNFEDISSVTLGSGDDTIIATSNLLVSNGSINSGNGTDRLIVDYSSASFTYLGNGGYGVNNTSTNSFEGLWHRLVGWGSQPLLNYNNVEVFQVTGTQYADYLRGYGGDDTLIGGEGNDDIAGGDGNDTIRGGDGNDTLKGEGGNDEIEGGDGNDTIDGGTGRHVIRGGTGDDTVAGAKAGDSIDGEGGNDTLQSLDLSSLGVDLVLDLRATEQVSGDNNTRINNFENISSVTLGGGYDTIIATSNLLVSNGSINAGGGTDTLIADYSSASFAYLGNGGYGVTNTYTNSFEGLWHRLVWGSQPLLNYNNVEVFQVTGTQYADYLRGYSGDDKLIGGEGNDDIAGGDGSDTIIPVNPNVAKPGLGTVDTVTGGTGEDTFILGDVTWIGYDDYNPSTGGTSDYLNIKDFNPQEDIIQLLGSSSDYTTTVSGNNINLYINKPDSEPDELIAVLENTQGLINPLQFNLSGSYFKYVASNTILDITSTSRIQMEGNSDHKSFVFTVTRTGDTSVTSTVDWFITPSGDNPVNSTDFFGGAMPPGEGFTFLPGETSKEIRVRVRGDSTIESNETFTVYLSTPSRSTIGTRSATGIILNDDGSQPTTMAIGTSGNDTLNGTINADFLIGLAGNDTYTVNNTGDLVVENLSEGTDRVNASISYTLTDNVENLTFMGSANLNGRGNDLNNSLTGNTGNNILTGLAGNDVLDGKVGADTLIGGLGNDTYTVDNGEDVVTENPSEGTDRVNAFISYTLTDNVENLTFMGSANLNGTGNDLNNSLTGNTGNNILNGGAGNDVLDGKVGADTLIGGLGNDTYTVDNGEDVVTENPSEGTDRVNAFISYTLTDNVENLTLTGSANLNGTGNDLNNSLTGNTGNNILNGGAGADTLRGGVGSDIFVFQFEQSPVSGADRITDFAIGTDKIDLLTSLGVTMNAPTAFTRAANSTATTLTNVVNSVFTDANGALTGNQALGVNSAALVSVTTSGIAGTYLVINDGVAGFQSSNDLLVNITGYSGTLPALDTIAVSSFFI